MTNLIRDKLKASTLKDLAGMRDRIQLDPDYQRAGDIWSLPRRQLLIDSILNDFDIPKLYFRALVPAERLGDRIIDYAVIDGRQRLEAFWAFMDGDFPLDKGADIDELSGLPGGIPPDYQSLEVWLPRLVERFLQYRLDVVTIETSDLDVVEDMFLRLNESSALSAAEKRNAFGGPAPVMARGLAAHAFFQDRLPYPNRRYRHFDMATKFLHFEDRGGVADTKKIYLDRFVIAARGGRIAGLEDSRKRVIAVLDTMTALFNDDDPLLTAVGMASVYFLATRQAMTDGWWGELKRAQFVEFERARRINKQRAAQGDEADADYDLLQFDSYAQSPNDAIALRFRRDVLLAFLGHPLEPAGQDGG